MKFFDKVKAFGIARFVMFLFGTVVIVGVVSHGIGQLAKGNTLVAIIVLGIIGFFAYGWFSRFWASWKVTNVMKRPKLVYIDGSAKEMGWRGNVMTNLWLLDIEGYNAFLQGYNRAKMDRADKIVVGIDHNMVDAQKMGKRFVNMGYGNKLILVRHNPNHLNWRDEKLLEVIEDLVIENGGMTFKSTDHLIEYLSVLPK